MKKVDATIRVPGSKSYTNRALIMGALLGLRGGGESVLRGVSLSEDSEVLVEALRKFGVVIDSRFQPPSRAGGNDMEEDAVVRGGGVEAYSGEIDVGAAGTAMRFLASFCSFVDGCEVVLKGSDRMHERPIKDLVEALRELGANIEYLGKEGCPPLKIRGVFGRGGEVSMNGNVSSQFFTSLLLVSPLFRDGLKINVNGEQISKTYIDMTISGMKEFGVEVENRDYKEYAVKPGQKYGARDYQVEGDASGASYFWGMAAISGGRVRVENLNPNSAQGDIHFPEILEKMGCEISKGEDWIEVQGVDELKPVEVDMSGMPDTAQTLAVVAIFANGDTKITGLATLKSKETDRLIALQTELKRLGVKSEIGDDFIVIYGAGGQWRETLVPAEIETYKDHRMAMSFGMLRMVFDGIEIKDSGVVKKSFPGFWEEMMCM